MCKGTPDWCGPKREGGGFKAWLISLLVPDSLWGVDISAACRFHDRDYEHGGTEEDKDNADWNFRVRIRMILITEGVSSRRATNAATIYFLGVQSQGYKYFNYSEES